MGPHLTSGQLGFEPGFSFICGLLKHYNTPLSSLQQPERSQMGTTLPDLPSAPFLPHHLDCVLESSGWGFLRAPRLSDLLMGLILCGAGARWASTPGLLLQLSLRQLCLLGPGVSFPSSLYSSLQGWFQPGLCTPMWRIGTAPALS